ncbi:hypothetical protein [Hymenobacter aerophilus]|uniref:hypothetical protein n=1 Tax=Hymenobacter aerophilus TaxID=119644 RepID=UPI0012FCCFAE|nr:hypothetical protein [Hymenobacter aerophilus]
MKAELIVANFCIHNINRDGANDALKKLANKQSRAPVSLDDIQAAEPFVINAENSDITHKYLKNTTLGFGILNSLHYRKYYQFDNFVAEAIN